MLSWFFGLLLVLFDFCLHFFDFGLLSYVDLVVLSEHSLILQQFLREVFAFLLSFGQLFFQLLDFLLVLIVVPDQFQSLGLLPLHLHQGLLLIL